MCAVIARTVLNVLAIFYRYKKEGKYTYSVQGYFLLNIFSLWPVQVPNAFLEQFLEVHHRVVLLDRTELSVWIEAETLTPSYFPNYVYERQIHRSFIDNKIQDTQYRIPSQTHNEIICINLPNIFNLIVQQRTRIFQQHPVRVNLISTLQQREEERK